MTYMDMVMDPANKVIDDAEVYLEAQDPAVAPIVTDVSWEAIKGLINLQIASKGEATRLLDLYQVFNRENNDLTEVGKTGEAIKETTRPVATSFDFFYDMVEKEKGTLKVLAEVEGKDKAKTEADQLYHPSRGAKARFRLHSAQDRVQLFPQHHEDQAHMRMFMWCWGKEQEDVTIVSFTPVHFGHRPEAVLMEEARVMAIR